MTRTGWDGWILIIQQPRQKARTVLYDLPQVDDANKRAAAARNAGSEVEIFRAYSVSDAAIEDEKETTR